MSDHTSTTADGSPPSITDACLPFSLMAQSISDEIADAIDAPPPFRGRLVRMGPVMDTILKRHNYPPIVARMLAEAMLLCGALGNALKYDGIFTLQAKGDGAVSSLVADVTTNGAVRAYAMYDAERVATEDPGTDATALLLGHGYIAFTVDQGKHAERYQGIVPLSGRTLADATINYFRQSEQIATGLVVAADNSTGQWRGGALLLQKMPSATSDAGGGSRMLDEDAVRRAMILLSTATPAELVDEKLAGPTLLNRLFHSEGLVVHQPGNFHDECRCNRGRVERVLRSLSRDEIEELAENNQVVVTCEFCNRKYTFSPDELHNLDKVLTLDLPEHNDEDGAPPRESVLLKPKSRTNEDRDGDDNEK